MIIRSYQDQVAVQSTKSEKRRVTAALSCVSTGHMLPSMIIFKGKGQFQNYIAMVEQRLPAR